MKGFFYLVCFLPIFSIAQNAAILKLANEISVTELRSAVNKLSAPEMEGSFSGTRGDTLVSQFIANSFKQNRLLAPYQKGSSYLQNVPLQKVSVTRAEITAAGKQFQQFNDWYIFPGTTYKSVNLSAVPVIFGGYGIVSDTYNDLLGENVEGKVVIIVQVQPEDKLLELLAKATRSSISADYLKNLAAKGAAGVLVVTNDFERSSRSLRLSGSLRSYRNPETVPNSLPRIYVSERMINEILHPNDVTIQSLLINMRRSRRPLPFPTKATIDINIQADLVQVQAPNVIGIIKGRDTTAEPVIVSAHHDHLGRRGTMVFSGASDIAATNAALIEIARLMQKAVQTGARPQRSIEFVSFTGEEIGLLGSYHYARNPVNPGLGTRAQLHLHVLGTRDSVHAGMPDSNYLYFLSTDTSENGLETAVKAANEQVSIKLDNRYQEQGSANRWLTGSDGYPFFQKGISVIQLGSGYPKSYHQLTDTPDKIDFTLLALQTRQAFLTLWNMANQ